jgi:hypothetical protein
MLVDQRVVFGSMNPVDEKVGEDDENWKLEVIVPQARAIFGRIVHLGVTSHLGDEEWNGEDSHYRQRPQCLLDLERDLILEVFGMVEGILVKNEHVRKSSKSEVNDGTKEPRRTLVSLCRQLFRVVPTQQNVPSYQKEAYCLTCNVIPWPRTAVGVARRLK